MTKDGWKEVKPIRSDDDHFRAVERISTLMALPKMTRSQEAELFLLSALAEKWEENNGHFEIGERP